MDDPSYRSYAVENGIIGFLVKYHGSLLPPHMESPLRPPTAPVTKISDRERHRIEKRMPERLSERILPLVRKTFAILGHHELPISKTRRGVRILSLDGGGTRALISIAILKDIEKRTGQKIYELFDLIAGCSTGAILAFFLGVKKMPLDDLEQLFLKLSANVFANTPVLTTAKMLLTKSYYDSASLETIFQQELGKDIKLIDTLQDAKTPRLFAVSTLVNRNVPCVYLFRNYNLPVGRDSNYVGGCDHMAWEALRCSTAAPSYFPPYQIGSTVHQDGGLIANNPSALAVHEARRLWQGAPLECLVSVGTGRADPTVAFNTTASNIGWMDLARTVISSATGTESFHDLFQDLLPADTYFRFNPILPGAVVCHFFFLPMCVFSFFDFCPILLFSGMSLLTIFA